MDANGGLSLNLSLISKNFSHTNSRCTIIVLTSNPLERNS